MASNFSRRSFLGGFLAAVSSFLGRKVPAAAASPPAPATPIVPLPAPPQASIDPLGSVVTYTYDAPESALVRIDPFTSITTYTYEGGRLTRIDPPPPPRPPWLGDGGPASQS